MPEATKPTKRAPAKKPAAPTAKRAYTRRASTRLPAIDTATGSPLTPAEDDLLNRLTDTDVAIVNVWIRRGDYIATATSPSYDRPLI